MPAPHSPTWEEVLAAFEASAAQAESLITNNPSAPVLPVAAYDVWHLSMPPLPAALRPRAEAIHQRQQLLAERLRASMHSLRQQQVLAEPQDEPRRSLYVDHLV
jgi:hypothetical protein